MYTLHLISSNIIIIKKVRMHNKIIYIYKSWILRLKRCESLYFLHTAWMHMLLVYGITLISMLVGMVSNKKNVVFTI